MERTWAGKRRVDARRRGRQVSTAYSHDLAGPGGASTPAARANAAGSPDADAPDQDHRSPHGRTLADRVVAPLRAVQGFLHRRALARVTFALPRTARAVRSMFAHGQVTDAVPAPSLSLGFAAQMAIDEALLAVALTPSRFPSAGDYRRVGAELGEARRRFVARGWTRNPARYHRDPPPLGDEQVRIERGWALGLRYQRLSFESGFAPRPSEPGRERWMSYRPNRVAVANLVRHDDGARPWLVCVHGFCMGYPFMDFQGLHTARLRRDLGVNVALPVLPLHGRRKVTLVSGEPFLSFELMNAVHGLTQAVWDIRRLLTWIRAQGATSIGLYGVSLGAYVVSLLAGIEPDLDAVVAGIPVSDFPALFHEHSPLHVRARSIEHNILGGPAEDVCGVVSPLGVTPQVPRERRFIFAGYGDRLARPEQAHMLWEHWERPEISWYAGNHVGYLWSKQVTRFVVDSLGGAGFAVPARGAGD